MKRRRAVLGGDVPMSPWVKVDVPGVDMDRSRPLEGEIKKRSGSGIWWAIAALLLVSGNRARKRRA